MKPTAEQLAAADAWWAAKAKSRIFRSGNGSGYWDMYFQPFGYGREDEFKDDFCTIYMHETMTLVICNGYPWGMNEV